MFDRLNISAQSIYDYITQQEVTDWYKHVLYDL